MKFLIAAVTAFGLSSASATPIATNYRYFSNGTQIQSSGDKPVAFNGVPIGTTELEATAPDGTLHSLKDGHHFGHRGWALTSKNGGSWEFNASRSSLRPLGKRAADASESFVFITPDGYSSTVNYIANESGYMSLSMPATESGIAWAFDGATADRIEFLLDHRFIAEVGNELIGDLTDIFFNALEIFDIFF